MAILLLAVTFLLHVNGLTLHPRQTEVVSVGTPSVVPTKGVGVTPSVVRVTSTPAAATGIITLTVWFPDVVFPSDETPGGKMLAQRLEEFHKQHHGIYVEPVRKLAHGPGGMLDYLRTSHAVAPKILPDIVILDAEETYKGIGTGALQPIEGVVPASLKEKMYRFAQETGWEGGHWYALFLQADMEHLAINPAVCSVEAPTWDEIISNKCVYLFPAAGEDGLPSDAEILHFLGSGGGWEKGGALRFDETVLRRLFNFYREGRDRGVIPKSVLDYATNDDCWAAFLAEKGSVAHVNSSRYLTDRGLLREVTFMPVPTYKGRTLSMADGWVVGIVTSDPARQQIAASLLSWLMEPDWYGGWCAASKMLPVTRPGMEVWSKEHGSEIYVEFLKSLLENAVPRPGGPDYEKSAARLHKAIRTMLGNPDADASSLIKSLLNPK